jgi:hypothetical protein
MSITRRRLPSPAIATLTLLLPPATALAQQPPASGSPNPNQPDPCLNLFQLVSRPTVTTAACAVQPRRALLELGYVNQTTSTPSGGNLVIYPQAQVRLGLFRHNELDLFVPSAEQQSSPAPRTSGLGDAAAGYHHQLPVIGKAIIGLNGFVTFPTGSTGFTAGGTGLTLNVDWSYAFSPSIGLSGTLGYSALSAQRVGGTPQTTGPSFQRFASFNPSIVVEQALAKTAQAFLEVFGTTRTGPGAGGRYLYDLGLQKQLSPDLQVDLSAGQTFTPSSGNTRVRYLGVGFARRFSRQI